MARLLTILMPLGLGAFALASGKGLNMLLPKPSWISTIVDIILGGLLIYIGQRKIFKKPKGGRLWQLSRISMPM